MKKEPVAIVCVSRYATQWYESLPVNLISFRSLIKPSSSKLELE